MRALTILLLAICCTSQAARILGIFPYNSHSHFNMYEVLMKELVNRGHHVTVLSHFPQKTKYINYIDLSVNGSLPAVTNNVSMELISSLNSVTSFFDIIGDTLNMCEKVLQHPNTKKLTSSKEEYDLILIEVFGAECFFGLLHKIKAPSVSLTSSVMLPWANARFGNPDNPAYIPNYFLPLTYRMTFSQRLINTMFKVWLCAMFYYYSDYRSQQIARRYLGEELPGLSDLARNSSLILVNSHFSINQPRPLVPGVVEVGGLHIKSPGKIEEGLEKFLNESKHGLIYFSLGSMVRSETMSATTLEAILDAFSELPQNFLWKVDGDLLPRLPSNVRAGKWLPQLEILAHPNTLAFITHGGLMGLQEALYFGVPMVGIPLFSDQELNIQNLSPKVAVSLDYKTLTKASLLQALNTVINDQSRVHSSERNDEPYIEPYAELRGEH
ncbi:unnamed protein product [Timema podura]|uniref:UDP-glucuronosyltransferase n=1 Tax=Timema podura TaxID=61482 RepID=A0ABN7P440_TIMPD|nr:unnamed protein product [Timema podura]